MTFIWIRLEYLFWSTVCLTQSMDGMFPIRLIRVTQLVRPADVALHNTVLTLTGIIRLVWRPVEVLCLLMRLGPDPFTWTIVSLCKMSNLIQFTLYSSISKSNPIQNIMNQSLIQSSFLFCRPNFCQVASMSPTKLFKFFELLFLPNMEVITSWAWYQDILSRDTM